MVVAKSRFDKKVYSAYYWHDQLVSGKLVPVILGMLVIIGLGIFYTTKDRLTYSYVMYGLAALLAIAYVGKVLTTIKNHVAAAKLEKAPYTVLFEITDKKIHTRDDRSNKDVTFKWSEIRNTYETGKYFFFYINKKQAIVLRKEDITEGKTEDIAAWAKAAKEANKAKK